MPAAAAGLIGGGGGAWEGDGESEGGTAEGVLDALGGSSLGESATEVEGDGDMEGEPLLLHVLVTVALGASEAVALGADVAVALGTGEAVALVIFGKAVGLTDAGTQVDEPGGVG